MEKEKFEEQNQDEENVSYLSNKIEVLIILFCLIILILLIYFIFY